MIGNIINLTADLDLIIILDKDIIASDSDNDTIISTRINWYKNNSHQSEFDDETLIRLQWPQLDRAQEAEPKKTVLIDNIESVTLRFLDKNAEWQEQWPPLSTGGGTGVTELYAIEIVLQLKDWGEIRRCR